MKVLLVSEGDDELNGALCRLVERLLPGRPTIHAMDCRDRRIRAVHRRASTGAFRRRAEACLVHGEKGGYDAVVFVIDEDGDVTRRTQIDAAQASLEVSTLNRACGVAIQTFDAWMLADVAAWSELIGEAPEMSPDPESIRAPKDHCEELVRRLPTPTTRSAAYVDVASLCRIEVVERRCPKGFGEFATRVRALAR